MKITSLFVVFLSMAAVVSAETEAGKDSSIGFRGMEIHTFKNGTHRLRLEDINNDGRKDIIFVNSAASRLEVLLRRDLPNQQQEELPELETVFDSKGVVLDQQIFLFQIADLWRDKPGKDILTLGRTLGVRRFEVSPDGTIGAAIDIFAKNIEQIRGIDVADLDGNGIDDIALFRDTGVEVLWNDGASGSFGRRTTLDVSGNRFFKGDVADVNADGNPDLIFFMKPPGVALVVRLNDGKGGFGLELPVDYRGSLNTLSIGGEDGNPASLAVALERGIGIRLYHYEASQTDALLSSEEVASASATVRGAGKTPPCYLVADVDEDGFDDLFVAAPELSRLFLYRGSVNGITLPAEVIDTYADICSISRLDSGDLLVVSRREKMAALHKADQLKSFPVAMDVEGEVCAGSALGDSVVLVTQASGSDEFDLLILDSEDIKNSEETRIKIPDLLNAPYQIDAIDLGKAGHALLMYVQYSEPQMFILRDGALSPFDSSRFRALSEKTLKPGQVRVSQSPKGPSITVCSGQTARTYEWDGERFAVVRQLNPADKQANLVATSPFKGLKGEPGMLVFDRSGRNLLWFKDGEAEPQSVHLKTDVGVVSSIISLRAKKRTNLILLGRDSMHLLAEGLDSLELAACSDYMSPSEDPHLAFIVKLDMGLPRLTLGLFDSANSTIEIAERKNGGMDNLLTFKIFESSSFVDERRGRHEFHGMAAGDIDGDGISDMAVLVQDRLLVYFGE